jgi:hypothetical protein
LVYLRRMEVPKNAINITAYWTWMGSDGIVRTKVKPNFDVTLTHAMENSDAVNSFRKEKKYPLLIDARDIHSITREAREFFTTRGRDTGINCMAVIIRSSISRVIGNFFMGINKPAVPTRLFENETEAEKWLKSYLQ